MTGNVLGIFSASLGKGSLSVLILRYSSSSSTPLSSSFLYSASFCSQVSSQSPRPVPVPWSFSRIRTITTIPLTTTARRINELISNETKKTTFLSNYKFHPKPVRLTYSYRPQNVHHCSLLALTLLARTLPSLCPHPPSRPCRRGPTVLPRLRRLRLRVREVDAPIHLYRKSTIF